MDAKPTVFLVDDDEAVCRSLKRLLESVGLPVETCGSADEFLKAFDPRRPGCLVLDISMPHMDGLELQESLLARKIRIPIIFLTGHGDAPKAVRAMKAGAFDFLEKPYNGQLLVERIRAAIEADARNREELARRADAAARLATLTPRERQVLDLLVAGKVSKQIALQLGLSRKTVDVHRTHIMMKLGTDSIVELVELSRLAGNLPNP